MNIFKKIAIGIVIVIAAMMGITEWMKYTTFDKEVSGQLNEESEVRSMSIRMNGFPDDTGLPEIEARATIEDQFIIEEMLARFSQLELKEQEERFIAGDYSVSILASNEVEENLFETKSVDLELGSGLISISGKYYEILTDIDPRKFIEEIVENGEIQWDFTD